MSGYNEALLKRARALHDAPNVTMDGHNDLPWALHDAYDHRLAKFDLREPQGHIKIPKLRHQYLHTDFPRCKEGGLTAQFWSVYVPTTIRGGEAVGRGVLEAHSTREDHITPSMRRVSRCRFRKLWSRSTASIDYARSTPTSSNLPIRRMM